MPIETLTLIPSAFLAPCTLPIVPGYLAFIAGATEKDAGKKGVRKRIVINAAAFVIGFSIVFILLGTFAGFIGAFIGKGFPCFLIG